MRPYSAAALPCVLLAAAICAAAQLPRQTVPLEVVVPAKTDLPPKNFTQAIPGSKPTFEMVYVPGGEFLMGSPEDEPDRKADEGPRRRVKVRPFWLAKCETTWDQFDLWYRADDLYDSSGVPETILPRPKADAITKPTASFVDENYEHGVEGHPALSVTHHAAMMYCHWLRWKTKRAYRLPTEAEWEFACRAGQTGAHGIPKDAKLTDFAWFKENSATADREKGTTHKVGTKRPNAFGLHDLHGNVAEWCLDHYDPTWYGTLPADRVSVGPLNKPTARKWGHTVRGGSWADAADRLRSAARRGSDKSWQRYDPQIPRSVWWLTKMDVIGFRVALPVEEYPDLIGIKPMVLKGDTLKEDE